MALKGNSLFIAIGAAAVLALSSVLLFGEAMQAVGWIGELFLDALQMLIVPLVFASIVDGISGIGDARRVGRVGLATIAYYSCTTLIAVITGLVLVNLVRPGDGVPTGGVSAPEGLGDAVGHGWQEIPLSLVSGSLVQSMADLDLLPVIVFAIGFGIALNTIGSAGEPVTRVFSGINAAMLKLVHALMWLAPLGIFGLVAARFAAVDDLWSLLSGLGRYMLTVIAGLLLHALLVLPLILWVTTRRNPLRYLLGVGSALVTAFATASSSATLPLTIRGTTGNNRIPKQSASFVLPIGATVNMDGTALYEAVVAVFVAQALGIDLSVGEQITVVVTATLAAIGAAGIPEAGLVTLVIVFRAVDLPVESMGLVVAVDWLLDRFRTATNVWGDAVGAAVVNRYASCSDTSETS